MKINIEIKLEEIEKDCYYFELNSIPIRVFKVTSGKWMVCVFSGVTLQEFDSPEEAVRETVISDNTQDDYKIFSDYLKGY